MGEVQAFLTLLCLAGLILLTVLSVCRYIGLWTWTSAWIFSSKEEKMNLTKGKGFFNANGYLVSSDSMGDINLCYSGSFKRFDNVDHDAVTSLVSSASDTASVFPSSPQLKLANYPQEISLPYGTVQSTDLSEFTKHSRFTHFSSQADCPDYNPSQQVLFMGSSSLLPSSASFGSSPNIPPQPLRLAPAPPPSPPLTALPKVPPRRPPPPVPPRANPPHRRSSGSVEVEELLPQGVQRALSCDSVCSDTSVGLADLEEPHVTGYLCIGLDYDSDCADLSVNVLEAKDLVGPDEDNQPLMNTYVRVYLLPDKTTNLQTRVYKKSNSPSYKEKFLFALEPSEFFRRTLTFYVYSVDKMSSTLIGEADLHLADVSPKQGVTTWVTLTDTGQDRSFWGELMLSLSYLPTAERLTIVIVKARNLIFSNQKDSGDAFVKVYLLKQGKKIHKKKTSTKKGERSPIFNEAMIFNLPASTLHNIQVRITVAEYIGEPRALPLGHVILGSDASGKPLSHWSQMMVSPRKPISMWHSLRKQ